MISPELNGLPCGFCSMIEKQPQMRFSMQACLKAATSGPSSEHMIAGLVSIESPCRAYSGNTTKSIVAMLRRALATKPTIFSVCLCRSAAVATTGSCSCTMPMTTPFGVLLRPPSPLIVTSLFGNGELSRRVAHGVLRSRGADHDEQRQDIRRRLEEILACRYAD